MRALVECPIPFPLTDKSQSVRARCNKAPRSLPIKQGIFPGGIRTSGLEVLPKGALMVLPMQSGTVKGSTQGASQDSNWKFLRREKNRRGALEVLLNVNECDQWFSKVRL